jgi:predicted nucleic acid-binding protein
MPQQRSFIDTNILIYAEACDVPEKQITALNLLKQHHEAASGVLSTQVLQEYCNVAFKKFKLSQAYIRTQLTFYEQFEIIQITPAVIHSGLDLHQTRSVSFFDALILASARIAGCSILLTEDMNVGEKIGGIQIVNPFKTLASSLL